MSEFVHLLVQSDATFLDSTCRITVDKSLQSAQCSPKPLAHFAASLGHSHLALTDRHGLYNAPAFTQSAAAAGITPIIGAQINLRASQPLPAGSTQPDVRVVLLAETPAGLRHLNALCTLAARQTDPVLGPVISTDQLAQFSVGLIAIIGGLYCEPRLHLSRGNSAAALASIQAVSKFFSDDSVFLALQRIGAEDEEQFNNFMRDAAKKLSLPLTIIHDVRYLSVDDAEAHDVLRCIAINSHLENETRPRLPSDQFYLKSPQEMSELFADYPELLASTVEIAKRCTARIEFGQSLYPAYPLPAGTDANQLLAQLCRKGLRERYPHAFTGAPEVRQEEERLTQRLDYELSILAKTGFQHYFLIVWDFIDYARRHGIPVGPGRGSAAGSLVAYCLRITDVDPFRFGLIFERFLNPERVSPPDVDIDFCPERRGEVIQYVREKYGEECVAQIITFGTLGAKAALRDVTRVLGLPYSLGDRLSKLVPAQPIGITLAQALEKNPELAALRDSDPDASRIIALALRIEGLMRQPGVHAAGVIIADRPLSDHIPLARAEDGSFVSQYDMNAITDIGLLKMDFLGLKTLTVIQRAEELIQANHQREIHWQDIPDDDPATLELLNQGRTTGIFQLESPGMRELCRQFQLTSIHDIIALIALYRPGPMDLIPDFIRRRHGQVEITYEHPLLEQVCADTYGIMIYQEQVMRAANLLAGYTLGGSDLLRRAMGKKDAEKMAKERAKFVEGCEKHNGIAREQAERIFNLLEKFAGYGFNKSHSAAYGILSYRTAWLKAHYPAEFLCALLTCEIGGKVEKIASFCLDAESLGIKILPPDINHSYAEFTTDGRTIRFGLAAIKNASETAMRAAVEERQRNGPYSSLVDLTRRNNTQTLNKRTLEALIKAGALDAFGPSRQALLAEVDSALAAAATVHRDAARGQASLFDALDTPPPTAVKKSTKSSSTKAGKTNAPLDWPQDLRLAYEREHTGLYLSGHPLDSHRPTLSLFQLTTSADASELPHESIIRVAGLVTEIKKIPTRSGRIILRGTLEDLTGIFELFALPGDAETLFEQLQPKHAYLIAGTLENDPERPSERPTLRPLEVVPLAEAPRRYLRAIHLHLPPLAEVNLDLLEKLLRAHAGRIPVVLAPRHPTDPHLRLLIKPDDHFSVVDTASARAEFEKHFGPGCWQLIPDPAPPLPDPRSRKNSLRDRDNSKIHTRASL